MGKVNYRQIFAINSQDKQKILNINPNIENKAGIYLFYRTNEKGEHCVYVGQATTSVLSRCGQHLEGYKKKNPTHIDLSLKNHKLYSSDNPLGWKVMVLTYCRPEECNILERKYIEHYLNRGDVVIYNVTGGGQDKGKVNIQERTEPNLKRYRSGVAYGTNKIKKTIREYFQKYLDYHIKEPSNKIKERKFDEFTKFIQEDEQK